MFHKILSLSLLLALTTLTFSCKSGSTAASGDATDSVALAPATFSADTAFAYLKAQCDFGARVPGSTAHQQCGDYIVKQFKALGLTVDEQFSTARRWDGLLLSVRNIVASYRPEAEERIVLAAHWDSRPWADNDPDSTKHHEPVMAANDGASGVAVLLEVARHLKELNPAVGIDFVCFDAEDGGAPDWGEGDPEGKDWCLGSQAWAEQARATGYRARYGILLDMVGGMDARFCREGFSLKYAESVATRLWETAKNVGAASLFVDADGGWATDDHVPMNEVAGIPTVDVVPYIEGASSSFGATWHTTFDDPEHISAETLRLVGQTIIQMIFEEQ